MLEDKLLEEIIIPEGFRVVRHAFFSYDPSTEFSISGNINYLSEDLFQADHQVTDLTVDLGWFGDLETNQGEFVLTVLQNTDWEYPVAELHSTSQVEMAMMLERTLDAIDAGVLHAE